MGGVDQVKESVRAIRPAAWLDTIVARRAVQRAAAREDAGVLADGDRGARPRHRREQRGLQRHQHAVVQAGAGLGATRAGGRRLRPRSRHAGLVPTVLLCRLRGASRPGRRVRSRHGAPVDSRRVDGRRDLAANEGRPGDRRLLRNARCSPRRRAEFHARRRAARERCHRRGAQPPLLAAAWQSDGHPGPDHPRQRPSLHRRRHRPGRVRRPHGHRGAGVLDAAGSGCAVVRRAGPVAGVRAPGRGEPRPDGRRPAEARRDRRGRERGDAHAVGDACAGAPAGRRQARHYGQPPGALPAGQSADRRRPRRRARDGRADGRGTHRPRRGEPQRGEHATGARVEPAQGNRHAPGARRRSRTHRRAVDDRRAHPRPGGERARPGGRCLDAPCRCRLAHRHRFPGLLCRRDAGLAGLSGVAGLLHALRHRVRSRPVVETVAPGPASGDEAPRGRRGGCGPATPRHEESPGRRPDCPVAGAAGRLRPLRPRGHRRGSGGSRLSLRPPAVAARGRGDGRARRGVGP